MNSDWAVLIEFATSVAEIELTVLIELILLNEVPASICAGTGAPIPPVFATPRLVVPLLFT